MRQGHTQGGGDGGLDSQWLRAQLTIFIFIVSGEAILSAENSGKPLGGRGSTPNPAGELTAGGERLLAPPKNHTPTLGFRPFGLAPPPMNNPGRALAMRCGNWNRRGHWRSMQRSVRKHPLIPSSYICQRNESPRAGLNMILVGVCTPSALRQDSSLTCVQNRPRRMIFHFHLIQ